jgi:hypothetical protein
MTQPPSLLEVIVAHNLTKLFTRDSKDLGELIPTPRGAQYF